MVIERGRTNSPTSIGNRSSTCSSIFLNICSSFIVIFLFALCTIETERGYGSNYEIHGNNVCVS